MKIINVPYTLIEIVLKNRPKTRKIDLNGGHYILHLKRIFLDLG